MNRGHHAELLHLGERAYCGTSPERGIRWTRWRRGVQVVFIVFFALLPLTNKLLAQWTVIGTLASLRIGPLSLVDPAAGIAAILASRQFYPSMLAGMILPLLLALIAGPVFCSWVCPWGLLSEMVDKLLRRRHRHEGGWVSRLRWAFLAGVFLIGLGMGMPLAATISAPRLITALPMEILFLGGASAGTLGLLGALLALEFLLPRRLWCRALCPVGSTLKLLRTPWTLTIAWNRLTCMPGLKGVNCVRICSWNLDPRHMKPLDGCTNCGACVEGCPTVPRTLGFRLGRQSVAGDLVADGVGRPSSE